MIDLHNQGRLNREIGEIFNVSRQTIPYLNDRVAFRKISEPLRPANIVEGNIL